MFNFIHIEGQFHERIQVMFGTIVFTHRYQQLWVYKIKDTSSSTLQVPVCLKYILTSRMKVKIDAKLMAI